MCCWKDKLEIDMYLIRFFTKSKFNRGVKDKSLDWLLRSPVTNTRTWFKVIPSLRPLEASRTYLTNKAYTCFSLRQHVDPSRESSGDNELRSNLAVSLCVVGLIKWSNTSTFWKILKNPNTSNLVANIDSATVIVNWLVPIEESKLPCGGPLQTRNHQRQEKEI